MPLPALFQKGSAMRHVTICEPTVRPLRLVEAMAREDFVQCRGVDPAAYRNSPGYRAAYDREMADWVARPVFS